MRATGRSLIGGIVAGAMLLGTLTACSDEPGASAPSTAPATAGETATQALTAPAGENEARSATLPAAPTVEVVEEVEPVEVPETLEEAPAAVPVNGTLLVVHPETSAMVADTAGAAADAGAADAGEGAEGQGEDGHGHDAAAGGVWLTTDDGEMLKVDEQAFDGEVATGHEFAGEIVLPEEAQQSVQERIDEAGPIPTVEAVTAAGKSAPSVVLSGSVAPPPAEAKAPSTKTHKVYIVNYINTAGDRYSKSEAYKLVKDTGAYWNKQTGGKFKGAAVAGYTSTTGYIDYCNQPALWKNAAKKFKKPVSWFEKDGRHLLVLVEQGWTFGSCGPAGLASLGASFHQGGTIWVDTGYDDNLSGQNMSLDILAHEMGHNLGLGHAQSRVCGNVDSTSGATDTADKWTWDGYPFQVRKPNSKCTDEEYMDRWSVMGDAYSAKPPTLNIAQKYELGVAKKNIRSLSSKSGGVQDYWINSAATKTGRLGLKVNAGKSGTVFVEYRAGTGQDSGIGAAVDYWSGAAPTYGAYLTRGVRVLKSYPKGRYYWNGKWNSHRNIRSSVLGPRTDIGQAQGMATGQRMYPYKQGVRISVLATTSAKAKVRIEYPKAFKPGGKKVKIAYAGSGGAIAGKTLKVKTSGKWAITFGGTPKKIKQSYQWYRNGKPIKRATKSSYKTTWADAGKKITVRVKPSAKGYFTGKGSISKAVKVKASVYKDVLYGHSAYKEISFMKSQGIVPTSTFSPKTTLNHDFLVRMLWNAAAPSSYTPLAKSPYKDIKKSHSAYKQISYAYEKGLYTGSVSKGKRYFKASSAATRAEISKALFLLTGHNSSYVPLATSPYKDVKKGSSLTYKAVSWMYQQGIYKGAVSKGKRYFKSSLKVDRTLMAKFMYRAYHAAG